MHMSGTPPERRRPPLLIPYLILAVSLIVTCVVAGYVWVTAHAKDRAAFQGVIDRNQMAIRRAMDSQVTLLRGAAGLFVVEQNNVSLKKFRAYVERLGLAQRYPGVEGIGVVGMSAGPDLKGLVAIAGAQGISDFEVRPPGPRQQYHAVLYLEPQNEHNRPAIGYDMFTDPTRRAAMELARDSGNAVTSGKVMLDEELAGAG